MSQCMIFVSAEEGLKAQVGVPGLRKRSAKKGWVFWQFHHEHIDVETGISDMIYTHPNTDLEHQFVSWVEGVLVTDVKEHANGVFSGKMVDDTLVGVHQLVFKNPMKSALGAANLEGTKTGRISSEGPVPSSNLPKSQTLRPVEGIVSDIRNLYAEEEKAWDVVDKMTSGGGYKHMLGTPFWEQKSDEAKFRIWKRLARRYFGKTLHRVVKNKAGHESIVSRKSAIEWKFRSFFAYKGDPRNLSKSQIAEVFSNFAKFQRLAET